MATNGVSAHSDRDKLSRCILGREKVACVEQRLSSSPAQGELPQIVKLGVTRGTAPSSEWPNKYIKQLNPPGLHLGR